MYGYLQVSKNLRICISRRFICLNVCDSPKLVPRLHCALPDMTKYAAGNVRKFLGFAKFANISTSQTFPLIQYLKWIKGY